MALQRALFYSMNCIATNETATGIEEQVGIVQRQMRQGVKCKAINSNGDGSRERRTFVECELVDSVVVGHGQLELKKLYDQFILAEQSLKYRFLAMSTKERT
jgi:hypothetical protein